MNKYLKGIKNKCRCGAVAKGIKEVTTNKQGNTKQRIVASNCNVCGLEYVADDYKTTLTKEYQETIHVFNKTN